MGVFECLPLLRRSRSNLKDGASSAVSGEDFTFKTFDRNKGWEHHLKAPREALLQEAANITSDIAMNFFGTTRDGLSEDKAFARRKLAGQNVLSVKKPLTWWMCFLQSIPTPFNIMLAVLATIQVAMPPPSWDSFGVLMVMVAISVGLRFWQEWKSEVASIKLMSGIKTHATVRRPISNGFVEEHIDLKDLVPGDVINFNPGDTVPADCRLLETNRLLVSQSSMTGESEPQRKSAKLISNDKSQAIFDLTNLAFLGTNVVSGTATALVVATGDRAYIASITEELKKKKPITAFERGIRNVSYLMISFMVVMVGVVLIIRGRMSGDWVEATIFSLSVAVGIVPEMLPAIVNTNLARGSFRLAKQGAIVKTLASVQNFGSMNILCSDKTGTLTRDEITLCRVENCDGEESREVLGLAYANAVYQSGKKNDIDTAIIRKVDNSTEIDEPMRIGDRVNEIPFHFEKRRSSAIVRTATGKLVLICKGAFEEVIGLSKQYQTGDVLKEMNACRREIIYTRAYKFNDEGYRVLGVATRTLTEGELSDPDQIEELDSNMVFHGLLTFLDPPREDAAASIANLKDLSVEIKVLTGDNLRVATTVCRALNITSADIEGGLRTITGPELAMVAQRSSSEFDEVVKSSTIFAKLTPKQKGEVILSLKSAGNSVGMLGDGINDTIALRFADVGISVNNAVNTAKDCADVILTEKSLGLIVDGVRTGRRTHGNTMKYIKMVASSNFGNVFSVLIAGAWLPYQPMTSLQILIQNLLYDFSQFAIPWDHMDDEYVLVPQDWSSWELLRFICVLGPTSSTIDMMTFCLNWFYFHIRTADDPLVPMAQTHWFLEGLLTQTIVVHVLRTAKWPYIQSRPAYVLMATTGLIMSIGLALPYITPIANVMGLVHPNSEFLGFLVAELVVYVLEIQMLKLVYIRCFGKWL